MKNSLKEIYATCLIAFLMISCQSSHGQDAAQAQRDRLFNAYMEVKKDITDENFAGGKGHVVQVRKRSTELSAKRSTAR